MGETEYRSERAFRFMGPIRLVYGVLEDGVGWPDPICFWGDLYEKRFLCGVLGVIEAGGNDAADGGVCLRPKRSSGDIDRWSCGTESPMSSFRSTFEYVLLASSVRWKCNSPWGVLFFDREGVAGEPSSWSKL